MQRSRFILRLIFGLLILLSGSSGTLAGASQETPAGIRLVEADETGVILEFEAPAYQVSDIRLAGGTGQRLSIPGGTHTQTPGLPEMPVVQALIGVPGEAQIALEILADEAGRLPGEYDLAPAAGPVPMREDFQPGLRAAVAGAGYDRRDVLYPEAPVRLSGEAWVRDQRIVRVELAPFQYNPARRELTWHRRLQVAVRFNPPGSATSQGSAAESRQSEGVRGESPFEPALRLALLNYEQARMWRGEPTKVTPPAGEPQASGPRYRIGVDRDGIYRLTCADFQAAGMQIGPGGVDPNTFHLSSQGQDIAISLSGAQDGVCDADDSLTFYGQQFSGERLAALYADENRHWLTYSRQMADGSTSPWKPEYSAAMAEKYTDENVYWLEVGGQPGPTMETVSGDPAGSSAPLATSYRASVHAERSLRWWTYHFQGEDTWYWERVQSAGVTTYTTTLSALAGNQYTARLRARVLAVSSNDYGSPDHWTRFSLNDWATPLDEATWDGRSSYAFEAEVSQAALKEGVNELHFEVIHDRSIYPTLISPDYYFDWFEIDYQRRFVAEADQLLFPVEENGEWQYQVEGFTAPQVEVYEIGDPAAPKRVLDPLPGGGPGNYAVRFVTQAGVGARLLAVAPGAVRKPRSVTYYQPPDLKSSANGADYIFIAPGEFLNGLQALAAHRAAQGLRTRLVDIRDVYNEFGDGIANPLAIKRFLAHAYQAWQPPAPAYVLLVGDGHWNPRGFAPERYGSAPPLMLPNLAWVDPWFGEVDDTNALAAIVGDDPLPDVHIARLPVSNTGELAAFIVKTLNYEQSGVQDWQRRLLFVADDTPDIAGDFVAQSEALIDGYMPSSWDASRIYLDDYKDTDSCEKPSPGSNTCPAVNRAIRDTLNTEGALLLTYFGHGSIRGWANEQIWHATDIPGLANGARLPVLLSMTCWDGYWIGPTGGAVSYGPGLVEEMLRASDKGVVGAFAAGGLGVGTGHDALAEGFYGALFDAGDWELGQAVQAARLALYATGADEDLLHTYTVLGDPALHILRAYDGRTIYLPFLGF